MREIVAKRALHAVSFQRVVAKYDYWSGFYTDAKNSSARLLLGLRYQGCYNFFGGDPARDKTVRQCEGAAFNTAHLFFGLQPQGMQRPGRA